MYSIRYIIRDFFANSKLHNKFIIGYITALTIPLLVIGSSFYGWYINTASKQFNQTASQTVKQAELYIAYMRQEIENIGKMVFENMDLRKILKEKGEILYDQVEQYKKIINMIMQIEENPKVYQVRIYVPDDKIYARSSQKIFPLSVLNENPYFRSMVENGFNTAWTDSYMLINDDGRRVKVVSYIVVIIDVDNLDQILGCIFIDILEQEFYTILKETKISDSGCTFIINGEGEIISKSYSDLFDAENVFNSVRDYILDYQMDYKIKDNLHGNFNSNGTDYYYIYLPVQDSDWGIIHICPAREVTKYIKTSIGFSITLTIICILLAIGISIIISRRITSGIHCLIKKMEELGDLDNIQEMDLYTDDIIQYSKDEIGQLQKHFYQMVKKIRQLINENYKVKLQRREAELKALQAQINPHFLYNVLDSINWMAIRAKAINISNMVTYLAQYYRMALSEGRDIITIREELEYVKIYLKIQMIRFGESLYVDFDVPEEILDNAIVKMTLQPLVENAIMHGILAKSPQKGTIRICGERRGQMILIQIIDDGIGVDFDKIRYILSEPNNQFSKGFGIKNVNERIKLYFGQEFGIQIKRENDRWTIVEICLPVKSL